MVISSRLERSTRTASLVLSLAGAAGGALALWLSARALSDALWWATTLLGIVLATSWVVGAMAHRRLGVDLIALVALIGALLVGELAAGALITVMLATGRTLEGWAAGRAERELRLLIEHGPRSAHRYEAHELVDRPLEAVQAGDLLMVQPGEVVPVDGTLRSATATVDESALTGEPLPVTRCVDDPVRSGVVNAGAAFDIVATSTAAESTFAGIVRLVESSSASTAPFVRLADRFAGLFLALSFAAAGSAWLLSGEATRAVAVLVVATPCPLILAAPVAVVSGLSRCARRGVVVKGGGPLEALARAEYVLFDKTGTLTIGHPTIIDTVTTGSVHADEMLRLAASVDQASPHVLAQAIVRGARDRDLRIELPTETVEVAGAGVEGTIAGHRVRVGNRRWVGADATDAWVEVARARAEFNGAVCVYVSIDQLPAGALILSDPIRPDAARAIRGMRQSGVRGVVMVTGDRAEVAASVAMMLGIEHVAAGQTPASKVDVVRLQTERGPTIMVGDGINDAPALAAATVGVAMGARGATASSETADIVLVVDRLDRLAEARLIARRSRTIAKQSVIAGMGLSSIAMVAAALGLLPPAMGAGLQELIDVAMIMNALRSLRSGSDEMRLGRPDSDLAQQFAAAHRTLHPNVMLLRDAADRLGELPLVEAMGSVTDAMHWLVDDIGPHEVEEDRVLYPVIAEALGGSDPTSTMSRTHAEIARMTAQAAMIVRRVDAGGAETTDVRELQRLLYGLYAVLELHFAQEDESFLSLADDDRVDT